MYSTEYSCRGRKVGSTLHFPYSLIGHYLNRRPPCWLREWCNGDIVVDICVDILLNVVTSRSKHKASQMQIHKEQKNVVQLFAQSNTPNVMGEKVGPISLRGTGGGVSFLFMRGSFYYS